MIFNKTSILILTHDLRLNQTSVNRYLSFVKTLNDNNFRCSAIGLAYPFKPHHLSNLKHRTQSLIDNEAFLEVTQLNLIQKIILFSDKNNFPFFIKKYFLALHILFFNVDQWLVKKGNFKKLNINPTTIISGGSGGIIQSAAFLAKKYQAKLVLDYRDPWNFGYHLLETNHIIYKFKRWFTLNNELKLLKKADHIITVSESLKNFFPENLHHKITVIENGSNYEQEDILPQIVKTPLVFNMVYLGTIYDEQLKDESFFKCLSDFIAKNNLKNQDLKLFFLGSSLNKILPTIISKYHLELFTEIRGRISQEEVLPYLLNASMFLHLKYDQRSKIITSKNSEYLMFRKPILLPVSDHGDLSESIEKYQAGYICNTVEEIESALNIEYKKYQNKESCMLSSKNLSELSRSEISKKLITVIENLNN